MKDQRRYRDNSEEHRQANDKQRRRQQRSQFHTDEDTIDLRMLKSWASSDVNDVLEQIESTQSPQ